jgi:hypothetical protein
MTRLEKCELLKSKGYQYDIETGKIYGIYGKEIKTKDKSGYISIVRPNIFKGQLKGHHYAFYMVYGNVDFEMLDHINQIKTDNKITNLRVANSTLNNRNVITTAKGYTWDKKSNKWQSQIYFNGKQIYLGKFNTEKEAREAYIKAKKEYHNEL